MRLAENIRAIRQERSLLQKQVAEHINVDKSTYSKIEKGTRELTIRELEKVAELFSMTIDQIVKFEGGIPREVVMEDQSSIEQMHLIEQLDEDDRQIIFKLIDKMLTNKKFKDFFNKNVASL